jgi:asparagine synthase (glutamine-hydrolysing)
MCGIAGIHAPGGEADAGLVAAMVGRMVHRGPDGDGSFDAPGIALGMRRLAIVDPQHGDQPLRDESGDLVAVFNGELYNHAELRAGLEARGHRLRSGSDGEVIPHLYEEEGPGFVELLNGIFAIALWDGRTRTLHLARDAFGVKPLYWTRVEGRLEFASELKALLADPAIPREVDLPAIDSFLSFRFIPSPLTGLRGIHKLRPGTVLSAGPDGVSEREFATQAPRADRRDRAALVGEYRAAFERAVTRQMMSDVPIGVMLSGGVDSGAVCAVMARHAPLVRAYTVGFEGGGDDVNEIAAARETAELLGAEHHSVTISEREFLDALPGSLLTMEEPIAVTSALAVRYVAELMRPDVKVALSGQGADEPMGGYARHGGAHLAATLRRLPGAAALARALPRQRGRDALARGLAALAARSDAELLLGTYRLVADDEKPALYRPEVAAALRDAPPATAAFAWLRERVADLDPLAQMLYVDTRFSLADSLLLLADKMSMQASVELRVPVLDRDLIALAHSAHSSEHVRLRQGKSLHKEAVAGLLPDRIVHRRKLGWETPVDRWLRGALLPLTEEVLLGEGELCRELFDQARLRRLLDEHAAGHDRHRELFSLLSLGLWHRGFVAAPPAVAAAQ